MLWTSLAGILFILAGFLLFKYARIWWHLTESWKSYRADGPSDLFLLSTKAGGICMALVGLVILVLPFFLPA